MQTNDAPTEPPKRPLGFAIVAFSLLVLPMIAGRHIPFTAALAFWFAGTIAGSMGVSKGRLRFLSGVAMCLNGLMLIWGFFALMSGTSH
jgi:hypothetical protein